MEAGKRADGSLVVTASSRRAMKKVGHLLDLAAQCLKDVLASPERLAVTFLESLADLPLSQQLTARDQLQATFQKEAIDNFFTHPITILCGVTGSAVTDITPQTSIYSIGRDSIMAIQVASVCRKEGIPLTTADIIRNTEVGRLCEVALAQSGNASEPSTSHLQGALPLVEAAEVDKALSRLGEDRGMMEEILPVPLGKSTFLACGSGQARPSTN
ncbi:phosphopantetheine attachment site domain-containing protein [Hirsutella rhossiliensis]|uniref:Phosphopantetheine attachment site domain-containing protein n=1 Tax=Hirsutella rhossiliensis TaxID=111463 RepID=A0A9P8SJB1_9HYPO|nr:phosphopantetheine attachment site domain-containing protein [Hirsutella rhossiliensis]KAH0962871.1 phosphopantetheine attachment site domain-containing protein [Hirsutella rhossiliensis]